jgi:DNA-binding LacI/PurR family transcriptional regulator
MPGAKSSEKGRVGIRDVARAAGVSIATVSQVLNGKGRLPDETRTRVREVADQLGYQPHPAARSLAGGRSGLIGLTFSTDTETPLPLTDTHYYQLVINAATEAALGRGYCLVVGTQTPQTDIWKRLALDGVLVVDPVLGDGVPGALRKRGTPMVLMGSDPNGEFSDPCVDNDNAAGTRELLDHLWERGARQIAMFVYPVLDTFNVVCEEAYREWCAEREIEPSLLVFAAAWHVNPRKLAVEALSAPDRPDAAYCLEDDLGLETARAALDCSLRVPDDLMIAVCADYDTFPDIPLTTLECNPARTAREAVNLLLDLIEERPVSERSIEIPMRLVQRASTDR